ncbi:MAG: DUF3109 family protein [Bacteroidia bacterium]|nr:DUF3109 family protein [Bacteroidia bacterium]
MIIVDNVVLDDALLDEYFVCDLKACKGACCVEGESGAPLEKPEINELKKNFNFIQPYLENEGKRTIAEKGVAVVDDDGELTTPLVSKKGACVYAIKNNDGIVSCAIEKAYNDKKINFQKPISCHLYPIRIERKYGKEFLFYHRWDICQPACACGKKTKLPLVHFLKNALIRKYGKKWFDELEKILIYRKQKNGK